MKKTKLLLSIICSSLLLLTACGEKTNNSDEQSEPKAETETKAETAAVDDKIKESVSGLAENEYDDLKITCEVMTKSEILPGSTIPLSVSITNNGDQKVIYTQGSGSFETPQALMLNIPGLQPILPQDYLGVATMDMRNMELLPGETIKHTLSIRVIEPNEKFNDYTYEKWGTDQVYMADVEWETLKEEHSDLIPATETKYEGTVYFLYHPSNSEQMDPLSGATGYSTGSFTVDVKQ